MIKRINDEDSKNSYLLKEAVDERKLNELLLKGRRVICIVFSSLLLTLLFGGFMLHENKLFKKAEHRHIKCNVTNFTVIDFYNLSVKMELIRLNKLLTYNLSIITEFQTILENITNQYNQMKLKIYDQINLQRECDRIVQHQRYQILSAQRDAYLQRFHVFQVIYVITVAVIFTWAHFNIPKFQNIKKAARIQVAIKLLVVIVLCFHVTFIFLTVVLPTRLWIAKKYWIGV